MIWRIILHVVGIALIVLGIPLLISPIPIGLVMIFSGMLMLIAANPYAADVMRWMRRRYGWFDALFDRAQEVLPLRLAEPLRRTDNTPAQDERQPAPGNGDQAEDDEDDPDRHSETSRGARSPRADSQRMMQRTGYPRYLQ